MSNSNNNEIVKLSTLNVESIQDWNQMVPVIREVFQVMNGHTDWAFHHEVIMDGLLSLDLSATKKACSAFLEVFRPQEIQ